MQARKYLLKLGALEPLLQVMVAGETIVVMRKAVWALANLCGRDTSLDDVVSIIH
jgi:hypothetical protein